MPATNKKIYLEMHRSIGAKDTAYVMNKVHISDENPKKKKVCAVGIGST